MRASGLAADDNGAYDGAEIVDDDAHDGAVCVGRPELACYARCMTTLARYVSARLPTLIAECAPHYAAALLPTALLAHTPSQPRHPLNALRSTPSTTTLLPTTLLPTYRARPPAPPRQA